MLSTYGGRGVAPIPEGVQAFCGGAGDERERIWALQKLDYPGFADYEAKTDREIPVVILESTNPTEDRESLISGRRQQTGPHQGRTPHGLNVTPTQTFNAEVLAFLPN